MLHFKVSEEMEMPQKCWKFATQWKAKEDW